MNRIKNLFLLFFLASLLLGCSSATKQPFEFIANPLSQKINNIIDLNGDNKSELIFWNTSTMSKPNKFLELCFFEFADLNTDKLGKKNTRYNFGEVGNIPFFGYFDEDDTIDFGVYKTNSEGLNTWKIKNGRNNSEVSLNLGEKLELPVPSDFNGDGKFDIVVYDRSEGLYKGILSTHNIPFQVKIGKNHDFPVPKDYDGDGKADFATYNFQDGLWTIRNSRDNSISESKLGSPDYLPIPSDYDGDGSADLCVWNFTDNDIKATLTTLRRPLPLKVTEKIKKELKGKVIHPVPGDYDGNGISELAFWDSSSKLLICFDIKQDLKKKIYNLREITNSIPVNNFFLMQFTAKKNIKDTNTENKNEFISDFDGDYVLDKCRWSKDTGTFICTSSRVGWDFALNIGQKTDIPVTGNFNADNITDIGVYRPGAQSFLIRYLGKSSPEEIKVIQLGKEAGKNSIPKISDYNGDGIDDFAVFNPENKKLIVQNSL